MYAERLGLEMLLAMARAPRRRRRALAAALAGVAFALIVVALVAVANDGVPHDDDHLLLQAPALESMLLAGWLLLPIATLSLLGVRSRESTDYLFARVPGARLWLAYLISLMFTGLAAAVAAVVLAAMLSRGALSDADGAREAFGWLFIRAAFFMVGGLVLCGVGLVVAVIAQAITTTVLSRRGAIAKDEVARARFLVGALVLVLMVVAFPISILLPHDPTRRLAFGGATAGLILATTVLLLLIARRADRRAKATGVPNWTLGMVEARLRPEVAAAVGGSLTVLLAWLVIRSAGVGAQTAEVRFACDLTGCRTVGLAVAGWLIGALPAVLIIAVAALWRRLSSPARIALLLSTLVLCGNWALFWQGGEEIFSERVVGPGGEQVISGLGWAGAGLAAVLVWWLVAWMLGTTLPILRRKQTLVVSSLALLLVALAMAVVRAEPARIRAEELFPATLRMNGDTLSRTLSRNQHGCGGILPDDKQLNTQECLFTAHAAYITDDSDAVVTVSATRYRDVAAARTVHAGLPGEVQPAGTSGEVLTDTFASFDWVVIVAAGHADGRLIAQDERPWIRWPLRQVSVHFISAFIGGGSEPSPDPSTSPKNPSE